MKLSEIIRNCGVLDIRGREDVEITSVTNDSRRVGPGSLFIAVNGCGNDGRQYIDKALENGAAAVMYEQIPDQDHPRNQRFPGTPEGREATRKQVHLLPALRASARVSNATG